MKRGSYLFLSWLMVAFGQPSLVPLLGILAAIVGFLPVLYVLVNTPEAKKRFWIGCGWFTAVQLVQLFWALGHPFNYIYILYLVAALLLGLQFGLFAFFVTKERITSWLSIFALSGLWVVMEWMRLFLFSGHPWHPIGLAFAGNPLTLQLASLFGVYGLSYLVLLINFSFLKKSYLIATFLTAFPFVFGFIQIQQQQNGLVAAPKERVALVQTNFPIEELLSLDAKGMRRVVVDEWRQIVTLLQPLYGQKIDLVVLPELVVPFGTFYAMYDYEEVKRIFHEVFGTVILPPLEPHFAKEVNGRIQVNNAFWVQSLANLLKTNMVVGLEDVDFVEGEEPRYYTVAYLVRPGEKSMQRYEKRLLVPMGEYIPLSFLRDLAAKYGISSSFTPGSSAKLLYTDHLALGVSICFEEIMGNLMRESREKGASLLLNLTNDAWYPAYGLPRVHLEHARLRTVEMGIPLVRSCNTGVTCAIDSLGRDIERLGKTAREEEVLQGVLVVDVPLHSYPTLYAQYGDMPVLVLSFVLLPFLFVARNRRITYT